MNSVSGILIRGRMLVIQGKYVVVMEGLEAIFIVVLHTSAQEFKMIRSERCDR